MQARLICKWTHQLSIYRKRYCYEETTPNQSYIECIVNSWQKKLFAQSTTRKHAFYVGDSKMVLNNRLRNCVGDIFVINMKTTTRFPHTRLWIVGDDKVVNFYSSYKDGLIPKTVFVWLVIWARDHCPSFICNLPSCEFTSPPIMCCLCPSSLLRCLPCLLCWHRSLLRRFACRSAVILLSLLLGRSA